MSKGDYATSHTLRYALYLMKGDPLKDLELEKFEAELNAR